MKLPRDLTGSDLSKALGRLGYRVTRQTGSHIRLSMTERGEHHIPLPAHNPLKIGTLAAILSDLENHHKLTREKLINALFG